jgi:Electron transfer DM13
MKKLIFFLIVSTGLLSCKKSNTNTQTINDPVNPNAVVLVKGNFSGNMSYTVNGTAEIVNNVNQKQLVLKGFSSNSGPDLKVYIATSREAGTFINLGPLKSTNGQQVYDISGMPDFNQYKFVLIWCQQFSVLFGSAELK